MVMETSRHDWKKYWQLKYQYKRQISTQNNKRNYAAAVCVYWHRFIFSVLLEKIRDRYVVDENIFSKFCLFGKKMIWGF